MPLILGTNSIKDTGYDVDNSVKFDDGSSSYLTRTNAGSDGTPDTWTMSMWVKRSTLGTNQFLFIGYTSGNLQVSLRFNTSDQLYFFQEDHPAHNGRLLMTTARKFRDCSSWYHIVVQYDSTQSTNTNRGKIFINGVQETTFDGSNTWPDQNFDSEMTSASTTIYIGRESGDSMYFDGYMAEVVLLDGTAATPTSFGEYDEDSPTIWKPKDVSDLTFGTHGFYLDFEDSSNLGNDANGGTDFTENNLAATDQATDTPTNNFCTLNSLAPDLQTLSEGNTKFTNSSAANWRVALSTIAPSAGKWYCEVKITENGGGSQIGVADMNNLPASLLTDIGSASWSWSYNSSDGNKRHSSTSSSFGVSYTTNDIISIALDLDNHKLYFAKNGTWQNSGDPTTGSTGTGSAFDLDAGGAYAFAFTTNDTGTDPVLDINYGNPSYANSSDAADANGYGAFEYAPPSGYYALNTKNLAEYG
jgi:hypothetical protein